LTELYKLILSAPGARWALALLTLFVVVPALAQEAAAPQTEAVAPLEREGEVDEDRPESAAAAEDADEGAAGDPEQADDAAPGGAEDADEGIDYQAELEQELKDAQKTQDIEEIIVTGGKQEGLQDVPISVTTFSATDIRELRIQDISDLADYTPNLEINTAFAASNPTIFIRGIGLKDYNANAAGAVAVVQDGVYIGSPAGQLFQLFDIESVEVMRGPQGSANAYNATAGTIVVNSFDPDGELGSSGSLSYGNFNAIELEGAIGFPVYRDILSGRVSFIANFRDGTTQNLCAGIPDDPTDRRYQACIDWAGPQQRPSAADFADLKPWVNNVKNWATRGKLRWQPTDDLDWIFNAHWGQNRSDSRRLQMLGTNPISRHGRSGTGSNIRGYSPLIAQGVVEPTDLDPFIGFYNRDGLEELDLLGFSLKGTWDIGSVRFTSITGYEENARTVEEEGDASPALVFETDWEDSTWQFTQELRAEGEGERHLWSAGAFFVTQTLDADNTFFTPFYNWNQVFDMELWNFAPFVHARYQILNLDDAVSGVYELNLEGGLRYHWERKIFTLGTTVQALGGQADTFPEETEEATWGHLTGDLTLSYVPIESLTTYLRYTRGMKGGHFNGSATTQFQTIKPVEPEFIDSVEMGAKGRWLDGRLQLNAALFRYWYEDLQVFDIVNEKGSLPTQQLLNSDANVLGVELEIQASPFDGFHLEVAGAWLDSEFVDFQVTKQVSPSQRGKPGRNATFDYSGNPLIDAPEWSVSGMAEYELPLFEWGTLVPQFDFSYRTKVALDPQAKDIVSQPAYWLVNARIAYRTPDEQIEIAAWVQNLTAEEYLLDAFEFSLEAGEVLQVWADPRTYGLTLSYLW
jgi:iron complex outermembrane receptor protein